MSGHVKCDCDSKTSFRNTENMRVRMRNGNHSYFEKPRGQFHSSNYSQIICVNCNMNYRTKKDVSNIPDE